MTQPSGPPNSTQLWPPEPLWGPGGHPATPWLRDGEGCGGAVLTLLNGMDGGASGGRGVQGVCDARVTAGRSHGGRWERPERVNSSSQ